MKDKKGHQVALFLSYLMHPLWMPLAGMLIIFNLKTYISYVLTPGEKGLILLLVFCNTMVVPLLMTFFLYRRRDISNMQMPKREERFLPFVFSTLFFFFTYYLIKQVSLPGIIYSVAFAAAVSVLLACIINFFWKISIHMIGIGGLAGIIYGISALLEVDLLPVIITLVLCSGLLGYARLRLGGHSPVQVFTGAAIGFSCAFLSVYLQLG